jgi:rubrerythrin
MGVFDSLKERLLPGGDRAIYYRCERCGREFACRDDLQDPDCPYCSYSDIEHSGPSRNA